MKVCWWNNIFGYPILLIMQIILVELGVVIGKNGKDIGEGDAPDYISGYGIKGVLS